jgi:hypothetical protein
MHAVGESVDMHVQKECTYIDLNLDAQLMKDLRRGEVVYCESEDRECVVKLSFWNGGCCDDEEDEFEEESRELGD